jgi:class 3 adenylate cyclase
MARSGLYVAPKQSEPSASEIGIETKAGLHTGLCEMRGDQAGGVAVEISKEVAGRATTGDVLLTNAVMDLVAGSGVAFSDRGACDFGGLFENGRLFVTA